MRAVLIEEFGRPPRIAEVPDPEPPSDGVVVDVEATGLCRSDWHAWMGHDSDITLPHVPGHEFVGRVTARGTEVQRVSVGDRVLAPFVCGCGICAQCASGNAQVCPDQTQPGFTHWGSFAERTVIRHVDHNAILVGEDATAADLVGLGCRFATAFRGLRDRAAVQPGEYVAVFGCGGVGLSAVMIARALEAEVLAVDISDDALELAVHHGASETVNSSGQTPQSLAAELRERWPTIAVTIDALGSADTASAGVLSLAPLGRHLQIGLLPGDPALPIGRVIADELTILGSHGMAATDYPAMLGLIRDGSIAPGRLVTRQIGLDEAPAALAAMSDAAPVGMTIIRP